MLVLAISFPVLFVGGLSSFFWTSSFLSFLCCNSFAVLVCFLVVTLLSAMHSQLKPRRSSDDYLPAVTRLLPPRVTPRVSLAVTLTAMGNYNTGIVRSEVPRLQLRCRLYWSIFTAHYITVARFSLISLLSLRLAQSLFLSWFPRMSRPCL